MLKMVENVVSVYDLMHHFKTIILGLKIKCILTFYQLTILGNWSLLNIIKYFFFNGIILVVQYHPIKL